MIAASREVGYIHEPFNPSHRPGVCQTHVDRYFLNVYDAKRPTWRSALQKTLSFQYSYQAEWDSVRSPKDVLRMIRDASKFAWHRKKQNRALMKDPIALFSAEWIAETFNAQVVVLMRHPAAFVSSLKRLGWDFPFEDLLSQRRLMSTILAPFREDIETYERESPDIIDQGILLWRIFAHTFISYRDCHPDWQFVRHEDLAADPDIHFGSIFDHLNLRFTDSV